MCSSLSEYKSFPSKVSTGLLNAYNHLAIFYLILKYYEGMGEENSVAGCRLMMMMNYKGHVLGVFAAAKKDADNLVKRPQRLAFTPHNIKDDIIRSYYVLHFS